MPRYAARVDNNHAAIRAAFEALGCSVLDLSRLGNGAPDLYAALGRVGCLVECKSRLGKLTPAQERFWASWGAWRDVCRDMGDVERITAQMRAYRARMG